MKRQIVNEIYRAFVLLGAGHDLLAPVGSFCDSLPDKDVLAELKAWNTWKAEEIKGRIEHYEISFPRSDCSLSSGQKTTQE